MNIRAPKNRLSEIISLLLVVGVTAAHAADGTWTNQIGGTWSDANNWQNGVVAGGVGSTAFFNAMDVPTNAGGVTVTVDYSDAVNFFGVTNANLFFGDTVTSDGAASWTLGEGGLGITLQGGANSIIDVDLAKGAANNLVVGWGTATIDASLHGPNALVKSGPNRLILNPAVANDYSGGTIISNGILELGNSATALGAGAVTFDGGALRLQGAAFPGNSPSVNATPRTSLANNLIVPTGQTGLIFMPGRPESEPGFSGTVTGGGTLNMWVDYVRGNIGGDWSGFTGHLNVSASTRGNSDLRFDTTFVPSGWANVAVTLTTNGVNNNIVTMYNPGLPSGTVVEFGSLSASIPGVVSVRATGGVNNGAGGSAPFVMQVGGLNTDASFSGNIDTAVGITKVGTGTWTLNGPTIENTGQTVISNGTLQIGSGSSGKLGRTAVVTNYATLAFGRSDVALVVTNVIDGPGIVLQKGGGRTTLSPATGANTYTGKTVVTNGTLAVAAQEALGASPASFTADQLTLNGGALAATTDLTLNDANRGIGLGSAGGTLGADGTNILTVAGTIGGSGNLTIANTGSVALSGANNYTGKTILSTGTLVLGSEALGAAPGSPTADQLTFSGGTLRSTASFAIDDSNRGVTVDSAGGMVAPDASTTLTISEPVAGSGTLTKSGAGTLTLNGADTHTGDIIIAQGTLAVGASGSISASPLISVNDGTTFDISAAGFTLGSGQTLGGNGTVVGNLTAGAGSTVSAGSGIGALNVTGNLALSGGATNLVEINSTSNDVINVSGNLALSGANTIALNILSPLPSGTYHLIHYGTLTGLAGSLVLQGYPVSRISPSLASSGSTIDLVLTGSNGELVWTGGLLGNAWDLNTTANWLNGATPDVFLAGDNVTFSDVGSTNPVVNIVGTITPGFVTVNSSTDYTFSGTGKISGPAALVKSGSDKLVVLTTNDYVGGSTINSGAVQVGNGTASGSLGSGAIVDNGTLAFNLPGTETIANQISGTGSLTLQAGNVVLTGDNAYGATVINGGATLQVGDDGPSGSLGNGSVTDNGALVYRRTGAVTNNGSISGSGSLTVQGSGTVALAADSSYSGPTIVDGGTLQVGIGGTAGTLGTGASVTVTNNGTVAFDRSDVVTNSVAIIGTNGALAQVGTGTLVITNDANLYGESRITAGRLQLGDGMNASGTLGVETVTVTSPGTLVFNRPDAYTFSNSIAGSGSVAVMSPSPLTILKGTLAGNTYSGGTTITNSTVILAIPGGLGGQAQSDAIQGADAGLGTGAVTFQGDSSLQLAESDVTDQGSTPTFSTPLVVPAGQTGTLEAPGRYTFSSTVSGAGTLNLGVNYVRGDVTGVWTNFTGQLNVVTNSVNTNLTGVSDFRWANLQGIPNGKVHLGDNVTMYSRTTANRDVPIGELTGTINSSVRAASGGGGSPGVNENWVVGGLNTDFTFDGQLLDANSFTKTGTGKWTLTGANSFTGNMTVSNGVLAFGVSPVDGVTIGSIAAASRVVAAGAGKIDASGFADDVLHIGDLSVQTLAGNGTVQGGVYIGFSGNLEPGFSTNGFGNLTVTSNVVVDGSVTMYIDHTGSGAVSSSVTAPVVTINNSGASSLNVVQVGTNDLVTGDVFHLFSGAVSGAGFAITNLPLQNVDGSITYVWTNKLSIDGTIELLSGGTSTIALNPTNITFSISGGNQLKLAWPADHTGWRLQAQTNALTVGISSNWVDVAGSTATNEMTFTINPDNGTVFYRLVSP